MRPGGIRTAVRPEETWTTAGGSLDCGRKRPGLRLGGAAGRLTRRFPAPDTVKFLKNSFLTVQHIRHRR